MPGRPVSFPVFGKVCLGGSAAARRRARLAGIPERSELFDFLARDKVIGPQSPAASAAGASASRPARRNNGPASFNFTKWLCVRGVPVKRAKQTTMPLVLQKDIQAALESLGR